MKETKFKQTEVGMIPCDWEVTSLQNAVAFLDSRRIPIKDSNRAKMVGKYPYYGASGIIDYVNDWIFDDDLILLGEDGANIVDRSSRLAFEIHGKCWVNNHAHVMKPNKDFCNGFLSEYLESLKYDQYNTGTAQPKLNREKCNGIPVIKPTIKEQQRIANALSDVDTLIANLEKLIAKKKNIKQGTMQQLLTGKKRLPGFGSDERTGSRPTDERRKECHSERSAKREESSGYKMTELGMIPSDWENVNISKTCTIKARIGWQGLKSTEYLNSGDYILVTGTDFKNGFIDWSTCSYVSEWRFKQDKNIQIKKGDVLVTKDGTIGKVAFLNEIPMEGTLNSGVFVVRSKDLKKIDSVYLSLVFKSSWFDNFLDEITSGSTIVHLYQKDFIKFNFPIPSSIEEQTAIANVLSDMDAEISAFETKLAKYRTLKTGMMQQLLTGKIRLV